MRSLVVNEQTERLRCITMVEEVDGVVGDEVGGIAFLADILPTRCRTLELRIPVGALVVEHMITVEALRLAHEVPLANHARLVARLLQQFGEEGARGVNALEQHLLSVLMTVETCDETGTTGRRQRVFDKRLVEAHSLPGNTVDVGRRREPSYRMSVGRDGLVGMVVAHDVDDVGPLRAGASLLRRWLCSHVGQGVRGGERQQREYFLCHMVECPVY